MSSSEIQAGINLVTAVIAAVAIIYAMLREYRTLRVWHFAVYGLGLGLLAWVALSYYAVLFVDPGFNVSLLRPVQAGWAAFVVMTIISRLIVVDTSADVTTVQELLTGRKECEKKIALLEEKVLHLEQNFILYRDLSVLKTEKIEALEKQLKQLREGIDSEQR